MRADTFINSLMYDSVNEPTGKGSIDLSDRSTFRVVHRHLLMLPLRGQFIRVSTAWSDKEKRYISQYHWMWLKTMGLNHEWIVGDPVGEPAWERKDYSNAMTEGDCPVAHMAAVQDLISLVDKNPDLIPAATYMKRPINNLFKSSTMMTPTKDDPIVQANRKRFDEMRAKQQTKSSYLPGLRADGYDPLKDLPPMNQITPTLDDIKAIIDGLNIKSDNYALGA